MSSTPRKPSHVLQTRKGSRKQTLYYDPNVFTEDMKISVSMLVGVEDIPGVTHFNTLHTNGQYQDGIILHALPLETPILGMKNVVTPLLTNYFINSEYDPSNTYTYSWRVSEGEAILRTSTGKQASIEFLQDGTSTLECTIMNTIGGKRIVELTIIAGVTPKMMLIVRNGGNIS